MKSSATLSLLFLLLPSIRAAALPQLVGSELESTASSVKWDDSGKLVSRSPQPGRILPAAAVSMTDDPSLDPSLEAAVSMTDDPSLDPSSEAKRDLSARSPQGPASNPGEFTDVGLSNFNPANRNFSSGSSASSSNGSRQSTGSVVNDTYAVDPDHDGHPPPGRELMTGDGEEPGYRRHHNGSHHHKWNSTHHEPGVLTEFNAHGEHIVVYNGTHYPNGTSYHPANKTTNGGEMLGEVVVAGDEVVVYRQPWNETRHHHHHHNETEGASPTATGIWLPSGTGWIPSSTGGPRYHRKVPSPETAGFRGPKWRETKAVKDEVGYTELKIGDRLLDIIGLGKS